MTGARLATAEHLVRRTRTGDQHALAELLDRTHPQSIGALVDLVWPDHRCSPGEFDELADGFGLWRDREMIRGLAEAKR